MWRQRLKIEIFWAKNSSVDVLRAANSDLLMQSPGLDRISPRPRVCRLAAHESTLIINKMRGIIVRLREIINNLHLCLQIIALPGIKMLENILRVNMYLNIRFLATCRLCVGTVPSKWHWHAVRHVCRLFLYTWGVMMENYNASFVLLLLVLVL